MRKRSSIKQISIKSGNVLAESAIDEVSESTKDTVFRKLPEKNPAAVMLGRLGGLKGGKARASKLSSQRRSEIASNAAKARWHNSSGK